MGLPSRTIAVQYIKDMFLNSIPYQDHRGIEMLLSLTIVFRSRGRWLSNIFQFLNTRIMGELTVLPELI